MPNYEQDLMDSFRKELDALLQRFPELPEFKLTVRPRVVIETKQETKVDPTYLVVPPEIRDQALIKSNGFANSADNALNNILARNPNIKVYEQ